MGRFEDATESLVARLRQSERYRRFDESAKRFGDRVIASGAAKGAFDFVTGFYVGFMTDLIERGKFPNNPVIHSWAANFFEAALYASAILIYEDHKYDILSNPESNLGKVAKSTGLKLVGITAGQFTSKYAMPHIKQLMQYIGVAQ